MSERHKYHRPLKGPESQLRWEGTTSEAWVFWPDEPALRCQWPTTALVERLFADGIVAAIPAPHRYAVSAVLVAYQYLLAHPCGTEECVQRLRALRRAERGEGGDND